MVAAKDKGRSEIVVRLRTKNGNDDLVLDDIKLLIQDCHVTELEYDTLELEAVAVAAREIIKTHIVNPLQSIPLDMIKKINDAWQEVKEPMEKLMQGRYGTCAECGAAALSDAMHDGTKFICPVCETVMTWVFVTDSKNPNGGRYKLVK